jgi:MYXO-CTERM domain-containing protein
MKAMLRRSVGSLVASAALLLAPVALAAGEPCFNDTDCPGNGGDVCGGDVCSWNMPMKPVTDETKPYTCVGAGTDPKASKGTDGWCTTTEDCKCRAQGAKCVSVYCTFVKPDQAPGAGGSPSGTAGSGTGGSGTAGAGTGGSGTGGSAGAGTAGAATAGTGTTTEDEGGCSVSAARTGTSVTALALGLLGLGAMVARRRRAA